MVDHQVIPAFRVKAGLRHGAVRSRQHRGSPFGRNVDPIVDGFPLSAGIPSGSEGVAEADGIAALHRPLKPAALLFADGINTVNVRLLVPGQLGQDRPCPVFIPIQPQTAGGEGVGPTFCFAVHESGLHRQMHSVKGVDAVPRILLHVIARRWQLLRGHPEAVAGRRIIVHGHIAAQSRHDIGIHGGALVCAIDTAHQFPVLLRLPECLRLIIRQSLSGLAAVQSAPVHRQSHLLKIFSGHLKQAAGKIPLQWVPDPGTAAQSQPAVGIGDKGLPDIGGIGRQTKAVGKLGQSGFLCRTGCQPHCPQHQSQRTGSAHCRPQRRPFPLRSDTGRLLPDRLQHPVIQPAGDRNLFHQIVIRTFHR